MISVLEALRHLPEQRDLLEQAIALRIDLRHALMPLGEHGRVLDYLREAARLAEAISDQRSLAQTSCYMTDVLRVMGAYDCAMTVGQRALSCADALGEVALQVEARQRVAGTYYDLGAYPQALEMLRWTEVCLAEESSCERCSITSLAAVTIREWLVWCLAEVGAFAEGVTTGAAGVQLAEGADHPYSLMLIAYSMGYLYLRQADPPQAILALERGLALCQAWAIQGFFPPIASALAYAYALSERRAEALLLLEETKASMASMSAWHLSALSVAFQSAVYLLAGHMTEATSLAQEALQLSSERQERGCQAWAYHLLGQISAQGESPDVEEAVARYRQALTLAEELGMRPLQAHCYLGLGTLYNQMGRAQQARTALGTAIELYRIMETTFWLPQAEAALAQVA